MLASIRRLPQRSVSVSKPGTIKGRIEVEGRHFQRAVLPMREKPTLTPRKASD